MYFDQGITPSYNSQADAAKVFANVPGVPEIFSMTDDNVPCSINGCGTLTNAQVVVVGYKVGYNGLYNITAALIDNFDPTSIIRLQDKKLGVIIDLRQNFYQAQLDTTDSSTGRFYLYVSAPAQYSSAPSDCQNTGGQIAVKLDSSITWSLCQLINSSNQVIAADSNVIGTLAFNGLAAGDYTVKFTYSNNYDATNNFHLNGNFVVASIGAPQQTIFTHSDVIFDALVTNASQFSWDFGDGTLINGVAHPDQIFLVPGTYTVNLIASNTQGCSATASTSVEVLLETGINEASNKNINVTAHAKTVTINMNDLSINNGEVSIVNILGQPVYTAAVNTTTQQINLDTQATGYYLVSVKNAGKVSTKRVFLTN
ncbi:MAG: hypothetical protein JWO06_320 [Bacteroidota bacterium]|nr:hypothetical protein [Bacteroidota bacterium]